MVVSDVALIPLADFHSIHAMFVSIAPDLACEYSWMHIDPVSIISLFLTTREPEKRDCFASTLDPIPRHGLFRVYVRGFSEPELGILGQLLPHTTN